MQCPLSMPPGCSGDLGADTARLAMAQSGTHQELQGRGGEGGRGSGVHHCLMMAREGNGALPRASAGPQDAGLPHCRLKSGMLCFGQWRLVQLGRSGHLMHMWKDLGLALLPPASAVPFLCDPVLLVSVPLHSAALPEAPMALHGPILSTAEFEQGLMRA